MSHLKLPLLPCLSSWRPAATIFGNNADVGVISFVFCFQAGQVRWRGHAAADSNFPQTLESMSGSHLDKKIKEISDSEDSLEFFAYKNVHV